MSIMPRIGETCQLCLTGVLDLNEGKGEELTELDHLDTFNFLARINPKPNSTSTEISKRYCVVCPICSAKIKLISGIRAESVKVKSEVLINEIEDREEEEGNKGDDDDEEDLELEELDQLSLFYAEHDDLDKDPDFAPKTVKKPNKKSIKKTKTSLVPAVSKKLTEPVISISTFSCQICRNIQQDFKSIEALKLHFIDTHHYNGKEKVDRDANPKDYITITCQLCSAECLSYHHYFFHVLSEHSKTIIPAAAPSSSSLTKLLPPVATISFSCETCHRTFRRKATLKSHSRNCYNLSSENGSNNQTGGGCKICGKDILLPRMAAHRSFEHVCRICDDQFIFANRKEKCQHLEIVHKWWTKNKVKKALGEVPCPREGCLQKFSRGSKRLKSHLKRDHDEGDSTSFKPKRLYECTECHALLKNITCLRTHMETIHGSSEDRTKCPYCEFSVGKWRKHSLYGCHIPAVHPEKDNNFALDQAEKRRLWKEDYANRSKIQCFLCDYAGSKASHLKRHYTDIHGYDTRKASDDNNTPDPDDPDGALCLECGEHFVNKPTLIRHLLKEHCCPKGEQCLYCPNRYINIRDHVNKIHVSEKDKTNQICKKCGEGSKVFNSFEVILKHTRRYHRKGLNYDGDNEEVEEDVDKSNHSEMKDNNQRKKKEVKRQKKVRKKVEFKDVTSSDKRTEEEGTAAVGEENMNEESMDGFNCSVSGKRKKYVPQHLAGICPFCELKFSDLLGHIRHKGHEQSEGGGTTNTTNAPEEIKKKDCSLCQESFNSVRELVTHRQLHPQFKNHTCAKCIAEFETIVQLRNHRANNCPKYRKKKKKKVLTSYQQEIPNEALDSATKIGQRTTTEEGTQMLPITTGEPTKMLNVNHASTTTSNLSTLLMMVNDLNSNNSSGKDPSKDESSKQKTIEYEGRGTVKCHICFKAFTIKSLLRRHYISHHGYEPNKLVEANTKLSSTKVDGSVSEELCSQCKQSFGSLHARIKHQLDVHSLISGDICPYCDSKWGWKKFDNLDEHVTKYHTFEMQSPIQTCMTCKTNFETYTALKTHRQLHEGGHRRLVEMSTLGGKEKEVVTVHTRVGMRPEVENRGGVKCQLCSSFKLRKDQLKLHYVKQHGYNPKLADTNDGNDGKNSTKLEDLDPEASFLGDEMECQSLVECNLCPETFSNNHAFIKHLLKSHCVYTGLICPYCRDAHHPQRFIDLQAHVTNAHMDKLTGYDVSNECKLCKKSFVGYAELRDHVQIHGDMFREPPPNKELYKENARRKRRERRINKQKQKQQSALTTKQQHIFAAPKNIENHLNNSNFTVLRKVTNEELAANKIRKLDNGQLVIDDTTLLARSVIRLEDGKKNGKQVMHVPIRLNDVKGAILQLNHQAAADIIDIAESNNTASLVTEPINFEEGVIKDEFGVVKARHLIDDEPATLMIQAKNELEHFRYKKSSTYLDIPKCTVHRMNEGGKKTTSECLPPPPPPNTPPPEKRQRLQKESLSFISRPYESIIPNLGLEVNAVIHPGLRQWPMSREPLFSDDDQGQTGIVVVNHKSSGSNAKKESLSLYCDRNVAPVLEMRNTIIANVLQAIKLLTAHNSQNIGVTNFGANITKEDSNIMSNKYNGNVGKYPMNLSTSKKDLVLPSAENDEMNFDEINEKDEIKVAGTKVKREELDTDAEIHLNNGFDTSVINSQTAAAAVEKFQQISSPFSVAALLAAAELDEELASQPQP